MKNCLHKPLLARRNFPLILDLFNVQSHFLSLYWIHFLLKLRRITSKQHEIELIINPRRLASEKKTHRIIQKWLIRPSPFYTFEPVTFTTRNVLNVRRYERCKPKFWMREAWMCTEAYQQQQYEWRRKRRWRVEHMYVFEHRYSSGQFDGILCVRADRCLTKWCWGDNGRSFNTANSQIPAVHCNGIVRDMYVVNEKGTDRASKIRCFVLSCRFLPMSTSQLWWSIIFKVNT